MVRRCDKLLFMSTEADTELGAVALPDIQPVRAALWNKTKKVRSRAGRRGVCCRPSSMCGSITGTRLTGS